jgi:uncharacterized membrane protein
VRSNARVARGDRLGRITDWFGTEIATVDSPLDGVALYVVASPAMDVGEPIAMVGTPLGDWRA